MKISVLAALFLSLSQLILAGPAGAQNAVPEYRYLVSRDVDFFGADLDALFDTDLGSCVQACAVNSQCSAFTFNFRSSACFPKSGVTKRSEYQGALSAEKIATDPAIVRRASARVRAIEFLEPADIDRARNLARDLGTIHPAGGYELSAVLDAARTRESAGEVAQAMGWVGVAVSLSDRADLWTDYARLLLSIEPDSGDRRNQYRDRATAAAINGYLRSGSEAGQANALQVLSWALEDAGRGRQTIKALRLAASLQSRDDILAALENAVGKYGFRITDSVVESDSAQPRICARFSDELARTGVDYEPFVRLPDPSLVVQPDTNQLCIDGLEHGKRYRVTFRSGLPSASGDTLNKDVELTHYVRDRTPEVRFPGRSYVLPKSADAALPVETVNLDVIELQLRRVSDRNLLRAVQDGYFGRPLSTWEDETFGSKIAEEIWTGQADVGNDLNRDMTTRLPMAEAIAGQAAGIYALTARIPGADPYDNPGATQWFVLSDLGMSSISGTDGLHVQVRGLADARPRKGVEVTLVSQANAVLEKSVTDSDGFVTFAPGLTRGTGGSAPALLLAQNGDEDIGFLSLTEPAFDLSDRGVEGRPPAGPVDVFMTTDRGAYRAGETIHATVLARDAQVSAVEGMPLIAIISRPDGVEYSRRISGGGHAGGHVFDFPVGPGAPRGTWRIDIKSDPEAKALASRTVLVEDFLPERIDFDLTLPEARIRITDTPPLEIDARYLFGAPGSDLSIEGQVILRGVSELENWPGYRFGRYDERGSAKSSYFGDERTDARGQATVLLELPQADAPGQPIEATIIARLADGSARPVERRVTKAVTAGAPIIGIKPAFDGVLGEGAEAGFELVALDENQQPMAMPVRWTLNRVETRYQWYQLYGNWNWEPTTRRTRIATGTADLGDSPVRLDQPVDWGRYELVVERIGGAYVSAALDFEAGWYAPADSSATPDRLEMSLDQPSYQSGDTARLRIVSRAAGTALVSVLSNHVISRMSVEVPKGESIIPIQVTGDWGAGAYVTATVIQPMNAAAGKNPTRSLGLAYAKVDPAGRALKVSLDAPESTKPRGTQRIAVSVAGAREGQDVWLTLAAVDLGILNLTGFESPDPSSHYFGQRRLGVELRDVYGRLIDGMNGAMGTVRSGGDASGGMRLQSPPPTQDLMAAFSGPVKVGPDGTAFINIDLPAFNGTVRLMAVAWSKDAIGQAEQDMLVRDPVVVTATLPRFLSPGDNSRMLVEIVHADGPAGEMDLEIRASGAGLNLGAAPASVTLVPGGKAGFTIPVTAREVGDPAIDITLTTPDGQKLAQTLRLPVRSNDPVIARTQRFSLAVGDTFRFSTDVFAGLKPGTGRAVMSAGPLARFDAPGLLTALDRYPYGCTEQVTSQAMPLLYLSSVAQAAGLGDGPAIGNRIDSAIARVLTRQASNGAFGLWQAESGEFWLDAYASDFLSRARAEGYVVPDTAFRLAMDNLRNRVNYAPDFDEGGEDIAYALLVLAREGAASMSDLRYYADVKAGAFSTPLAVAQIGAALASYGDQTRADAMFARAASMLPDGRAEHPVWRADFGTNLRDTAGVLALASEAGSAVVNVAQLTGRISNGQNRMSTQEAAWTLLAAQALVKNPEHSGLRVNGAPVSGAFVEVLEDGSDAPGPEISSVDNAGTEITLTTLGVPEIAPEAGGTGYAIERSYFSMDGEPVDTASLRVGDRFVAVLTVKPFENSQARLMVDDPLPAGVEIDNPSLLRSGDVNALSWLNLSEASHSEFRSDRFLAAIDLREGNSVAVAYVARAVTPGTYHQPAASVEDMYRPAYRARTGAGRVVVTE